MKCPACGVENPEDKDFCGDCGARLPEEVAAPAAPPAEAPAPAAPAYQAPPPAYQTPPAGAYAPPAPAAPKKKLSGPVIAIVAGVLVLCALSCCIGGFLVFKPEKPEKKTEDPTKIVVKEEPNRGKIEISKEQGFETSMDALTDVAQQYYQGEDWWYLALSEEDDQAEYYITPDETTYDKGVILERRDDEWFVTDIYTVDMSQVEVTPEEDPTTENTEDITPEEWAAWTVNELLTALTEGRIEDAYTFTMQPLSDYDLSEFTGQIDSWEFLGAEVQDDGSVVVLWTMYWTDGTSNNVGGIVQAGDEAWYVSDMASAEE